MLTCDFTGSSHSVLMYKEVLLMKQCLTLIALNKSIEQCGNLICLLVSLRDWANVNYAILLFEWLIFDHFAYK